ncbi:MAG: hypothetical protein RDU30_06020 [Desulfovibrionaceae bacterium]|nr:hypothetical protein [Desulfovibrionaceae bacterium]
MKRLAVPLLAAILWAMCGFGHASAADSLTVFFAANTHGAFAPCPT